MSYLNPTYIPWCRRSPLTATPPPRIIKSEGSLFLEQLRHDIFQAPIPTTQLQSSQLTQSTLHRSLPSTTAAVIRPNPGQSITPAPEKTLDPRKNAQRLPRRPLLPPPPIPVPSVPSPAEIVASAAPSLPSHLSSSSRMDVEREGRTEQESRRGQKRESELSEELHSRATKVPRPALANGILAPRGVALAHHTVPDRSMSSLRQSTSSPAPPVASSTANNTFQPRTYPPDNLVQHPTAAADRQHTVTPADRFNHPQQSDYSASSALSSLTNAQQSSHYSVDATSKINGVAGLIELRTEDHSNLPSKLPPALSAPVPAIKKNNWIPIGNARSSHPPAAVSSGLPLSFNYIDNSVSQNQVTSASPSLPLAASTVHDTMHQNDEPNAIPTVVQKSNEGSKIASRTGRVSAEEKQIKPEPYDWSQMDIDDDEVEIIEPIKEEEITDERYKECEAPPPRINLPRAIKLERISPPPIASPSARDHIRASVPPSGYSSLAPTSKSVVERASFPPESQHPNPPLLHALPAKPSLFTQARPATSVATSLPLRRPPLNPRPNSRLFDSAISSCALTQQQPHRRSDSPPVASTSPSTSAATLESYGPPRPPPSVSPLPQDLVAHPDDEMSDVYSRAWTGEEKAALKRQLQRVDHGSFTPDPQSLDILPFSPPRPSPPHQSPAPDRMPVASASTLASTSAPLPEIYPHREFIGRGGFNTSGGGDSDVATGSSSSRRPVGGTQSSHSSSSHHISTTSGGRRRVRQPKHVSTVNATTYELAGIANQSIYLLGEAGKKLLARQQAQEGSRRWFLEKLEAQEEEAAEREREAKKEGERVKRRNERRNARERAESDGIRDAEEEQRERQRDAEEEQRERQRDEEKRRSQAKGKGRSRESRSRSPASWSFRDEREEEERRNQVVAQLSRPAVWTGTSLFDRDSDDSDY